MNQMNNGSSDSNKFNEQSWDGLLEEYEKSIGLNTTDFSKLDDVNQYLALSRDDIERLTGEDCAQIAYVLKQYAFHWQKAYNREIARANFAQGKIDLLVADEVRQYSGSWEQTRSAAIKHNELALKMYKVEMNSRMRADRINFISKPVSDLAEALINIQISKGRRNG